MALTTGTTRASRRREGADAVDDPVVGVSVRGVARGLVLIGVALAAAHLVVHTLAALGVITYEGRVISAFDMDDEVSIPTWFNMMLLAGVALGAAAVAVATRMPRARRGWAALAIVFAYLSLDEGAALHESLMYATRNALGITGGPLWYAWVIPVGIALVAASPFAIRFLAALPRRVRTLFVVAGVLYVGGALGIEVVSATAGAEVESLLRDENDPVVWLLACFEESLEIAGLVVVSIAVLIHLRDHALAGRALAVRLR
ncbi:hypothetical protein RYJ27_08245 [Microbacterium limosum]|uniref:Uncharacterized protein n=1 Tax=Microbacterium limosum TaxID=3079935 RepID=A0AAU0MES2_9MICO|nr:hypothetical protein [Microbacterium sp. Y20]WOQ68709.1 hypothetical protein RYJ27_08245 [Microbacterium sp. Y20]